MPLDLPDGTACFIDANIVYYHFVESSPLSDACTGLFERIADGQIKGYTSVHVLAEAVHKIMLAEAAAKFGLSRPGLVNWLQHHRKRIAELSEFRQDAAEMSRLGLSILSADAADLER